MGKVKVFEMFAGYGWDINIVSIQVMEGIKNELESNRYNKYL